MTTPRAAPARTRAPRARVVDEEPAPSVPETEPSSSETTEIQRALIVGTVRTDDGAAVPGAFVALGDLDASEDTALTDANG